MKGSKHSRWLSVCVLVVLALSSPAGVSPDLVISQVYGGGGNAGAQFTHDFVELFNRGSAPASLDGMSIQYTSATGTGNFGSSPTLITELPNVILEPGQYFLVQEAIGINPGTALPTPDLVETTPIAMAAGAGKVALVEGTASLGCNGGSTTCSGAALARIRDLVGYGNANFFEGAGAAPTLTNMTAAFRADSGCADTDSNSADFSAAAPAPRNNFSTLHPCQSLPAISIDDVTVTEGNSGTVTATFTVRLSSPAEAPVNFSIATQDDSATAADGDYIPTALTAQTILIGQDTYSFQVSVLGDATIEANETFFVEITDVSGADVGDGHGVGTITNDDVAPPAFDVVISQVYGGGGNAGATLRNDYIELFNHGLTPVDLTGWSVQYASATGSTWAVTALSGVIEPGRYYLVREAAGAGGSSDGPAPDASGTTTMSATSGRVALSSSTAPFIANNCPAGGTLIDLVGYGAATCFEGAAAAPQLTNATAALRKRGGCFDTNDNATDFSSSSPNPRNSANPPRSCEFTDLRIHDIQGPSLTTPYLGIDVTTTGVVTAAKFNGFFLQAPDVEADADPLTSEGIFVFTSAIPTVVAGDAVQVRGTVSEFFSLTQIESTLAGDVTAVTKDNPLPTAVALTPAILNPAGPATRLEPLEGMRVHADAVVSVAPTNEFGEIFTVLSGTARPMREPGIEISNPVPPDPITGVVDCCIARWDENPERIMIDSDGRAGAVPLAVTSNVTLGNITGPLDFTFGDYKVIPETVPVASANMTAVPVPSPAANEFTIGGYNIENFTGDATQQAKAALAIRTVMRLPDVIGHVEIGSQAALSALAGQVSSDAVTAGQPDPGYQAFLIPFGNGTQHVGFLVKTSRVRVDRVTQERTTDTFVNPVNGQVETLHDRPPLVLRATVDPLGVNPGDVIVVVNHLRSFIDIELVGGEGVRVRAKRTAQAEAIAELLQDLQQQNPNVPVISVGDYNAYEFSDGYTDPISVLKGTPRPTDQIVAQQSPDEVDPDYVNLTDSLPLSERYSFIFEGTPQALDHVLLNTVAQRYFQRYAIARNNADFPAVPGLTGDVSRPERNSDHDMPVAYFAFPGTPVVTLNGSATMTVEAYTSFVDPGATARDDTGPLPVTVTGTVDINVPGQYTLTYTANNGYKSVSATRIVRVVDTIAPLVTGVSASPDALGSPNHEMIAVSVQYSAADASGPPACSILVSSNEPTDGRGDGHTAMDWQVLDGHTVLLRAERSGRGTGRIYTLTVSCTDRSGNTASAFAGVSVSK
jgi:predicted extracellular nuclease